MAAPTSPYASGTYDDVDLQRSTLKGKLTVAKGIRERALAAGDTAKAATWTSVIDDLLDRLTELVGLS